MPVKIAGNKIWLSQHIEDYVSDCEDFDPDLDTETTRLRTGSEIKNAIQADAEIINEYARTRSLFDNNSPLLVLHAKVENYNSKHNSNVRFEAHVYDIDSQQRLYTIQLAGKKVTISELNPVFSLN